jgi:Domain of Unknown Function (DUF748)/AsmA family
MTGWLGVGMKRWLKIVLAATLVLLLLAAAIPLALPSLVRSYGGDWLKEKTGRTLAFDDLSLNLLTWSLELRKVSLSEPNSKEVFASFDRMTLRVSPMSLFEKAVIVTEFQLVGPKIQIFRDGNRFNFSDFTDLRQAEPEAPVGPATEPGDPFLFSLNNMQIINGVVLYVENQDGVEQQRHSVRDLNLSVPFIGNTPYLVDRSVTPFLHVFINDAPLDLGGKLKVFSDAVEVAVNIDLKNVDIPFYFNLIPQPLPLKVSSGSLDCNVEIVYRVAESQPPQLQVAGEVRVAALRGAVSSGGDLLFLPFVVARIAPSQILDHQLHLDRLHIYNPEVYLERDQGGRWSFADLIAPASPAEPLVIEPEDEEKEETAPFLATIDDFLLKNGRVVFRDELPEGGFHTEINDLTLAVTEFSTAPQSRAGYVLSLQTGREERLQVSGGLVIEPLAVEAQAALNDLRLETYTPYLTPFFTAPVSGLAGLQAKISFSDGRVNLEDGRLDLNRITTSFGGDEGVELSRLSVAGVRFDGGENRLEIGKVELADGRLTMTQSAEGRLSFLNLLREPVSAAEKVKPAASAEAAAPLYYQLQELTAKGLQVTLTDQTPKNPVRHRLSNIDLSLKNLSGPDPAVSPFRLHADYGRTGNLTLSGEVVAATGKLTLDSRLKDIALTDFAPYIPESVRLVLADGALDSDLKISLVPGAAGLKGAFSGNIGIRNFYCLDVEHHEELLRWGNLQLDGIRGELNPFVLHIDGVSLNDYGAKVVIDEAGRLNLQGVVVTEESDEVPVPQETPSATGPPAEISINAITLQGGTVAFADRQLQPSFATTMYQLGGRIGRISSAGDEPAEVDLRGHLENFSPLQISGRINPLVDPLFADIKISFKDIELSPVTPYTGTYLGYVVAKGKLFLDLEYRIDDHLLQAQNRVLLDQFNLGEKVESEQAVNLPVKLAVALLKDRSGAIRLDIPVSGSLDDPEFSVWSVVLKVLKNLLIKAASSPLSLLQAAFGGGEDFTVTVFPFGTAELLPQEQEKLGKLAEMLLDRPALRMEISGFADLEKDSEEYRRARLRQQLRKEKFLELVDKKRNLPGQTANDMIIEPEKTEHYLEKVYDRADFSKPLNFLGFDKSLPASEMEKLILSNTAAGPEQMAALAQERATAVVNFLTVEKGLPMERLFLVRPDLQKWPKEKGVSGNRVEFGVVAR